MNCPKASLRIRNDAFSFVEILIVFALVAVAVTIGFFAVGRASKNAKEAHCIARMRQVAAALIAYSTDHQSRIPPRNKPDPAQPGKYIPATLWFQVLRAGGYTPMGPFSEKSLHVCPEYATVPVPSGQESYGLRRWRSPGGVPDVSQSLLSITNRSDFFILACSVNTVTQRQGYCIDGYGEACVRSDTRGRVKTLFADGHVAIAPASYFEDLHLRQADYHVGNQAYKVNVGTPSNYSN